MCSEFSDVDVNNKNTKNATIKNISKWKKN
jgi:hypothetical protein